MAEAPDLEILREYLDPRIVDRRITAVNELRPLVVRNMIGEPLSDLMPNRTIDSVKRHGKLLLLHLSDGVSIVVSPMLTGDLALVDPIKRVTKSSILTADLDSGAQLRYSDIKRMGQIYIAKTDDVGDIKRLSGQGPDALDEPLAIDEFLSKLKRFRGEIKGVLTRGEFVSGLGNAYSDEVLWAAGIYPFKKSSSLSDGERRNLHSAVYRVPREAVAELKRYFGKKHPRKYRKLLKVHGKAGSECPACESKISSVKSRQRDTNFCRSCQPGSMFS